MVPSKIQRETLLNRFETHTSSESANFHVHKKKCDGVDGIDRIHYLFELAMSCQLASRASVVRASMGCDWKLRGPRDVHVKREVQRVVQRSQTNNEAH